MKLKLLVLYVFLGSSVSISAQNDTCTFSISGRIVDANTNDPVPYAVVKVDGSDKYASANTEGNFKIDGLCSKNNTLIISSIGFVELTVQYEGEANPTFSLNQEVTGLDGVTLQGERAKEAGTESISQVVLDQAEIKSIPTQPSATNPVSPGSTRLFKTKGFSLFTFPYRSN